jgi:outer membrane lipoprotein-sorting protein
MKNLFLTPLLYAVLLGMSYTNLIGQDARAILLRVEENMRGTSSYNEMTMQTVRPRFTREVTMKSWSLGEDYSLILITAPARDAGTAFLKRKNEIWNYVPNIDRTVKMPPSMMAQSWMGSDFTNDDLVRGSSTIDDFDHKLLGKETIDGIESWKIELKPHPDTPTPYEKVIQWISTEKYLPVRIQNFDERDQLMNTVNFSQVKTLGGREFPTVMEMIPNDKPGHKTVITTHKADFGINLNESFFSQQNMRTVR